MQMAPYIPSKNISALVTPQINRYRTIKKALQEIQQPNNQPPAPTISLSHGGQPGGASATIQTYNSKSTQTTPSLSKVPKSEDAHFDIVAVAGKQFLPENCVTLLTMDGQILAKIIPILCLVHIRRNLLNFLRLRFIPPSFTRRSSVPSIRQLLLNDLTGFQVWLLVLQVATHCHRHLFQNLWNSIQRLTWGLPTVTRTQNCPAKIPKSTIHLIRDYETIVLQLVWSLYLVLIFIVRPYIVLDRIPIKCDVNPSPDVSYYIIITSCIQDQAGCHVFQWFWS